MARTTRGRLAAKRVLTAAVNRCSRDVVVISKDRSGDLYLATSMSSKSSLELDGQIKLVEQALKRLRRIRHYSVRNEKAIASEALAA